ncbi:MAG: glycosyltransferase [Clostridia bacterium]|nr:glycosyltransferase [Clostridia bacterium]
MFGNGLKSKIKKYIDKKIYSKYETIVFVSKDNMRKFKQVYKEIRNKYLELVKKEVIFNYIDKEKVLNKAEEQPEIRFDSNNINIVTVARLVPQKAIDRLIRVHKRLIEENISHQMYVIGDGPEKEKLQKMIDDNKINDTFHLLGKKENPYPYIKEADYFCLLSNFEGYPMVLVEAKILNKSIIITDTAARETVENYPKSTILENNEESIFEGLKQIIQDNKKVENQEIEEKYNNDIIIEKIKKLLNN